MLLDLDLDLDGLLRPNLKLLSGSNALHRPILGRLLDLGAIRLWAGFTLNMVGAGAGTGTAAGMLAG